MAGIMTRQEVEMRKALLLQLILIFTLFNSVANGNPLSRLPDEEVKELLRGEVIAKYERQFKEGETPSGAGTTYVIINASIEQCWRIFTEFEKHYEWLPTWSESNVLERNGNKLIIHAVADFKVAKIDLTNTYTVEPEKHRVYVVTYPEGKNDIKYHEATYLFEKIDEKRTLFTFTMIKLDIGFNPPFPILKYFATRNLPELSENLKKRIESNGAWKKK